MAWQNVKGIIYLDMDGTIADLYGVPNWLEYLEANSAIPYRIADPLCNMSELARLLTALQKHNYEIGVITWGSRGAGKVYSRNINRQKRDWLKRYGLWEIVSRNYNYLDYGTNKSSVFGKYGAVPVTLIDDDKVVRGQFAKDIGEMTISKTNNLQSTYDPMKNGILSCLYSILETITKEEEN